MPFLLDKLKINIGVSLHPCLTLDHRLPKRCVSSLEFLLWPSFFCCFFLTLHISPSSFSAWLAGLAQMPTSAPYQDPVLWPDPDGPSAALQVPTPCRPHLALNPNDFIHLPDLHMVRKTQCATNKTELRRSIESPPGHF